MMRKTGKLFLICGMIICIICGTGCLSSGNDQNQGGEPLPHVWIDYIYNNSDGRLVENKLTVRVKQYGLQQVTNLYLSIFIDNEEEAIESFEIPNDKKERFFEYFITDYDIQEYIKFKVSYDFDVSADIIHHENAILYIYGYDNEDRFVITKIFEDGFIEVEEL